MGAVLNPETSESVVSGEVEPPSLPKPIVAIVGRPNVGKSTIFNRLIKRRKALESEKAGTTRDRVSESTMFDGIPVELMDTAGLGGSEDSFEEDVTFQAQVAIEQAQVIVFVVSAVDELTVDDFAVADILRKAKKPTVLVANKCDNPNLEKLAFNMYELGFGEPVAVSAVHSKGLDVLKNRVEKLLQAEGYSKLAQRRRGNRALHPRLCLIGRPNVGKSSFLNAVLKEKRAIVSDVPGTTRDAVDTEVVYEDRKYTLIDTAGIRRRGKVERGLESLSVLRSLRAIERSDIALLLIDYEEGITNQDKHVCEAALKAGKGIILIVNKVDLMPKGDEYRKTFLDYLQKEFPFLSYAPVIFTSALNGKNVQKVFGLADQIMIERYKRIPTHELNAFIKKTTAKYGPRGTKNVRPKIYYVTQASVAPPRFVFFTNRADAIHFSYKRSLENQIREKYGYTGTVVRMDFRSKSR